MSSRRRGSGALLAMCAIGIVVIGGLRWNIWRYAALDVNAGYAFGRYYGEGGNRRDELYDLVDIAPGPFLGSSLIVRF